MAPLAKNLPVMQEMQETWVRSLGLEDSLEKEMATHSSILAWRIPWTKEPGGLQSMGHQERLRANACVKGIHMDSKCGERGALCNQPEGRLTFINHGCVEEIAKRNRRRKTSQTRGTQAP